MSKETEKFIDDHSQKWILAPEESVELVASLDDALKSQNPDEVREILKDPQKLRRMILDRRKVDGKAGKNLVVLRDSFDFMFVHSFKDKDFYSVESGDIVKWMKNEGLPEYLLNEMMATAFYLHDDRKFFRLSSIISENKDKFEDKTIFLRAMHDLASWESTAEGGDGYSFKL
ncbi:MAG TPA: hypothetical protein VJB41_00710 [Patescibacteria group bacterium]|nr:hypothetical protein [Patescibacteria group bacterium]